MSSASRTRRGIEPEVLFDELLRQVPPGSMGLVLQPYWSPGCEFRGRKPKGAIIGFGIFIPGPIFIARLSRACPCAARGQERHEQRSGNRISTLRVSGGGSQSDEVMQITADIFNMAVERPHTYETSGLGAAINAAVGIGCIRIMQRHWST